MKQLYTIMALAAGVFFSAQQAEAQISNVSDLYGEYNAVYAWGFDTDKPDFLITPTISAGEAENEVLISNLFPTEGEEFDLVADTPIKATVDLANMTLTMTANQDLGTDDYGTNTLYIAQYNPNQQNFVNAPSVTATITNDKNIIFPADYVIGCQSTVQDGGFWYVFFDLFLQPYSGKYELSAAELVGAYALDTYWDSYDANDEPIDAPSDDFNVYIAQDDDDSYEIEIQNLFPYLGDFDIEAEILPSGDIMIMAYQQFNTAKTIYQLQLLDYENLDYLDYVLGSVAPDGTIIFPEPVTIALFAFGAGAGNPFQGYYGYNSLQLIPTEDDGNGVEAIEFDINAPVKYFNLKGMEVKNPQKGEVLIKTQGAKKAKVLVK